MLCIRSHFLLRMGSHIVFCNGSHFALCMSFMYGLTPLESIYNRTE